MKKFFRVALVCALAGATLLYTGCTKDYSEDLNSLQKKVEEQGATIKTQGETIASLQNAIGQLQTADENALKLITNLTKKVDTLESDIEFLKSEKGRLEGLIGQNTSEISGIKGRLDQIDTLIANLTAAKDSLSREIDSLKARADAHQQLLDTLRADVDKKAEQAYVDQELGKKADITWVQENYATTKRLIDTAAALRASLMLVNKEIQDIKDDLADVHDGLGKLGTRLNAVADSVAMNDKAIKQINTTITTMQSSIDTLLADMQEVKDSVKTAQETADSAVTEAAKAWDLADSLWDYLTEHYYTMETVDQLLSELEGRVQVKLDDKLDIETWKKDTARINAKFREIDSLIVKIREDFEREDSLIRDEIDTLDSTLRDLIGTKVDTSEYYAFVKAVWKRFAEVQVEIDKLIGRVQSLVYVPEYDDARITLNWAQMFSQNIFDLRDIKNPLPPSFDDEAWKDFYEDILDKIPAELEDELRQAASTIVGRPNGYGNGFLDFFEFGRFPTPEQYDGAPDFSATPIVEPTHVKFRVYGIDPATLVEGLVKSVNEGQDLLSFDVVRVLTRVNKDNVALNITHAEVDDLFEDGSVIDLTVVPENLPNDFWLYTWDVKNFMNPKTHVIYFLYMLMTQQMSQELYAWLYQQFVECAGMMDYEKYVNVEGQDAQEPAAQLEEDAAFPAFSVSLVLNDVSDTTSRMITSIYHNVVPAANPDRIDLWIRRGEDDVTYKKYLDTLEIEYTDLAKYDILANTELMFHYKGQDYTFEEFQALGINIGEPQARFFAENDFSESIAETVFGEELPEDYFVNTSDDQIPAVAQVNLKDANLGGVGAKEYITLVYYIGPASCWTYGLVKVVPHRIYEVVDIWETEDLTPFTWNYAKDAAVDAAIFRGETPDAYYQRDSAVAKYDEEKVAADFAACDIDFTNFAGLVPKADTSFIVVWYEDGARDTIKLADLLEEADPRFNIYPFFDTEDGDALKANVTNFLFNDLNENEEENHGAVVKYTYYAMYNLPSDDTPAIEVNVTGTILIADRDRGIIIVDLPETFEPWVANYKERILDTLNIAKATINPEIGWPNGTYAAHSLTDPDLVDAYGKGYTHTDSLTMTVDGKVTTKFAEKRIVTTVDEDVENHVLDYWTSSNFNVSWAENKLIEPYQTFQSIDTLWYGQIVIVNKTVRLDVDGIFEFERIPEYVDKIDDHHYYTELQPWWKPDNATLEPYDVPVNGYDAHEVLLNQHFRIIDVLKSIETGEKVWATEIATTPDATSGDIKEEYVDILARIFKLEEEGPVGEEVDFIADPRAADQPDLMTALEALINKDRADEDQVQMGVTITTDSTNVVSYYSESEQEDAVGKLFGVNSNGSYVLFTTNFNRGDAEPSPRLTDAGVVIEDYSQYVIKKYDPLYPIEEPDGVQQINANNSVIRPASIYQFIQIKDKRGYNLIGPEVYGEDEYGTPIYVWSWLTGNVDPATKQSVVEDEDPNGFEVGVKTNEVYSLVFTHELEFVSEVSEETQARIHFDPETGIITFDNTLQTSLKVPIDIKLNIKIEYPWNTQTATVMLQIVNIPVGTNPEP